MLSPCRTCPAFGGGQHTPAAGRDCLLPLAFWVGSPSPSLQPAPWPSGFFCTSGAVCAGYAQVGSMAKWLRFLPPNDNDQWREDFQEASPWADLGATTPCLWLHCLTIDMPLVSVVQSVERVVQRDGFFSIACWAEQSLTSWARIRLADNKQCRSCKVLDHSFAIRCSGLLGHSLVGEAKPL